jgi:hypothetical protein
MHDCQHVLYVILLSRHSKCVNPSAAPYLGVWQPSRSQMLPALPTMITLCSQRAKDFLNNAI